MHSYAIAAVEVAPHRPHHKESLAIYKLFTSFATLKITRLLNHKYQHHLPNGHRFSTALVNMKWQEMVGSNDAVYLEARGWTVDYWRVRRVLEWAEKDDRRRPL